MKRKIGLLLFGMIGFLCLFFVSTPTREEKKEEIREVVVDQTITKDNCDAFYGENKWQMNCEGSGTSGFWGAVGVCAGAVGFAVAASGTATTVANAISNEWCTIGAPSASASNPSQSSSSSTQSTTESSIVVETTNIYSIDDCFEYPDVKDLVNSSGKSKEEIKDILQDMVGCTIKELEERKEKKVLPIGRDIEDTHNKPDRTEGYQNYAEKNGYISFFSDIYKKLLDENGWKAMDAANVLLVVYCAKNNWDFVLVTDPYYYVLENFTGDHGGFGYRTEIALIRKLGYKFFTPTTISWATIASSPLSDDPYGFAGYYVSKSILLVL